MSLLITAREPKKGQIGCSEASTSLTVGVRFGFAPKRLGGCKARFLDVEHAISPEYIVAQQTRKTLGISQMPHLANKNVRSIEMEDIRNPGISISISIRRTLWSAEENHSQLPDNYPSDTTGVKSFTALRSSLTFNVQREVFNAVLRGTRLSNSAATMKLAATLASLCLLLQTASAHYIWTTLIAGSTTSTAAVRQPLNNSPVTSVTSKDITCNVNPTAATDTVSVAAGSTIGFKLDNTLYHQGPAAIYLGKAPSGSASSWDGSGANWFKASK
ncbi:hypothetical protein VNI00_007143 [Paramarasmius palmivorus]|uniref:AA9 family lytic polysaccharide monooxygenase n=1 Tax=Paramarasmius palmivorus TaxID=297713 RepID=A0AAW0D5K7_9AGAR